MRHRPPDDARSSKPTVLLAAVAAPFPFYCQVHPCCALHVVCVESAVHGVTVPVQTDEVDCQ
jgi:hypothetical protein